MGEFCISTVPMLRILRTRYFSRKQNACNARKMYCSYKSGKYQFRIQKSKRTWICQKVYSWIRKLNLKFEIFQLGILICQLIFFIQKYQKLVWFTMCATLNFAPIQQGCWENSIMVCFEYWAPILDSDSAVSVQSKENFND